MASQQKRQQGMGLEVVFKFANHNCRFENLAALKCLMDLCNETQLVRYVPTPTTPTTPPPSSGAAARRSSVGLVADGTGLELGRTRPTIYDYGYAFDGDSDASRGTTPAEHAITSPIGVVQADLSDLDRVRALPMEAPPRDLHSSDSHVRHRPSSKQWSRGGTPISQQRTQHTPEVAAVHVTPLSETNTTTAAQAAAISSDLPRPASTPYEYRPRTNGAGLEAVFHFSMSYLSSRTWGQRYPDVDPRVDGLVGLRLLHGAVQGIRRELPYSYSKVQRGAWHVADRSVARAIPRPLPALPPIVPPPAAPYSSAQHPVAAAGAQEAGGSAGDLDAASTHRRRLKTAERIRRHTQRLQAELRDIEASHNARAAKSMHSYGSRRGTHSRGGMGAAAATLNGTGTLRDFNATQRSAASEGAGGLGATSNTTASAPAAASTTAAAADAEKQKSGTSTSLPSIFAAHKAARAPKELNRTTGAGLAGFIRGPSRTAALIEQLSGPGVRSPHHTPRSPDGAPSQAQAFVRSIQHRGLFVGTRN